MSPIAIPSITPPKAFADAGRRPSPWHEIAHSLSSTPLPSLRTRRSSSSSVIKTPEEVDTDIQSPLSSSQAFREWELRLSLPDAPVTRHHLSPRPSSIPKLAAERDKEGHIEYKLKLIDPTPERFERLVTQMMWRLLQGRNEAIYEIGLADDGTVIGLTRSEMDASLRTLELMASEVGATVLILKEIILAGSKVSPKNSISSSSISVSSCHPPSLRRGWPSERPDLVYGKPRLSKGRRTKRRGLQKTGGQTISKNEGQITFDVVEMEAALEGSDSDDSSRCQSSSATDDDIPPFYLDLEDSDTSSPPSQVNTGWSRWQGKIRTPRVVNQAEIAERELKTVQKRLKSAARRDERRLDLLRGDGKSPSSMMDPPLYGSVIPHQPVRPSSLRLATPVSHEEGFMNNLLNVPLDSLSLSFADVCTVTSDDTPLSTSGDTIYAIPLHGEDMICVEALVVRKAGFAEDGVWGFGGGEDGWGFGGEEVEGNSP